MSDRKLRTIPMPSMPKPLPPFQAAGTHDCSGAPIASGLERFLAGHIAAHYLAPLRALKPAPFAVVVGPPGEGKSHACRIIASRAGVDLVIRPAADFAGAEEGSAVRVFEQLLADVGAIRAVRGKPIAVLVDDIDTGIVGQSERTEFTVNTQLLAGRLQSLADTSLDGDPLPFLFTTNSLTFRSSLFREGRGKIYHYTPNIAEKAAAAAMILGAASEADGTLVGHYVAQHPERNIASYAALKTAALESIAHDIVRQHGVTGADAEAAIAAAIDTLTVPALLAVAEAQPANSPSSYL